MRNRRRYRSDSTSSRCRVTRPATSATATTAIAAGQEADDDVAERDDAADNGVEDTSDARDDGSEAVANGPEDGLDL